MMRLPPRAGEEAFALARDLGVTRTAAAVLVARGLSSSAETLRFLDPRLADLTPPSAMVDRAEAIARLARAVRARERICVFGDYDADGVTAAALLTDVLRALGGDVATVLADRFDGGYGLSGPALARVQATRATLLVTCDCGSSDHERLDSARRAGIDAVVIDHHRVPADPLPALAFLNPHRPDCGFPYKGLASVGLALSVGAGVRAELATPLDMRRWLDFVAIGTIGDVAPLDGDNRALVRAGLASIARGSRPGLRALSEIARCKGAVPTGEDVSFRLAPRINAPGRLEKPDLALELLLAANDEEASRIAAQVEIACTRRKEVERGITAEALAMLDAQDAERLPAIVLGAQGWHPGVIGIVAGRLASRFGKPSIVLALDGPRGKGSARAPAGFSVYDALCRVRDLLVAFGGHHAAAGVEIESCRLDAFRDGFASACAAMGLPESKARSDADAVLEEGEPPGRVLGDLERLEPCGQANPAPVVAIERARVLGVRELRGGHLRVWLETGRWQIACFGPEMGALAGELGQHVRVTGALRRDTYAGHGVEMRLAQVERV